MNKIIFFLCIGLFSGACQADSLLPKSDGLRGAGASPVQQPTNEPLLKQLITDGELRHFLSVEEAFIFSAYLEAPNVLIAHWQIAEGYYLYRDKFKFSLADATLETPIYPPTILKTDKLAGEVETYLWDVTVKLPFTLKQSVKTLNLTVTYQGCAEDALCYPPTTQTVAIELNPTPNEAQPLVPTENSASTVSPGAPAFLKAAQAFTFSAEFPNPSQILTRWQIANGYYLYRDKFKFSIENNGELGTVEFPPATLKQDPNLGETPVYTQASLEIPLPLKNVDTTKPVTLIVTYQGCAESGLCYPPLSKTVELILGQTHLLETTLSEQDRVTQIFFKKNLLYTIIMFFGFGLLLAFTPCVFPMIPILSSLIVGQGQTVTPARAFSISLAYVLAVSVTYTLAGIFAGLAGQNLQIILQQPWVLLSFALLFVILALSMFGFYELQLPSRWQTHLTHLSNQQQGGSLLGAVIMGFLSALIVGPCVAAPLAGALLYISQTKDAILGGLALFFMSLGMGIPLLLIGISAGQLLPKAGVWMNPVKAIFGVILLAVAIWTIRNLFAGQIVMLLWATLLIISAIYLGALEPLKENSSNWRKLWKGLGFILLIYGIVLMVGAAQGRVDIFQPLGRSHENTQAAVLFKPIKDLTELEQTLAAVQTQNKPILLDVYADWCVSCQELEKITFVDPAVQKQLAKMVLLRIDVTANSAQDQALYQHFGLYGPPVLLFFAPNGQEQRALRVVGFIAASAFREHLDNVLNL